MPTAPLQILLSEDVTYPVSIITSWEEPVATGSLSSCQILFLLPHLSPDLLNWGREGGENRSGERKSVSLPVQFPPVLFFFSFPFLFLMNLKIISLFATAAHTILLPPLPILDIYSYEMEQVFNLSDVTES